ncbi:MAG: hypothetical protein ACI80N_003641 [Gammaproteobacteria bacterium]|jgi:hypothetical protein
MLPILLATVPLLLAQESTPVLPAPFDRTLELEITEYDEPAIEGHGPTAVAEYEVEFEGTLHVWTESDLDLFLRVDDAAEARPLASDDNSGGGTTPYIALEVRQGDWLVVLVAGNPGATGNLSLTLRLIAAAQIEAGRAAERLGRVVLAAARRLMEEGEHDAARAVIAEASPEVMNADGEGSLILLRVRMNLANLMSVMGDLAEARALHESVVADFERFLPADHPDLLRARGNLAALVYQLGDLAGARAQMESVLAGYERSLPEGDLDLSSARESLAVLMNQMGDLAGARALRESVLAIYERSLPEDDPVLLLARGNLAVSMHDMGDLAGARALRASLVAAFERILPEYHPDLLWARGNLANSMYEMGDLSGARALRESVLAGYERNLPEDHPDLVRARLNLAASLHRMGDLAGARALKESVLASFERILPEDHPNLLLARGNLAVSMAAMGDLAGARALEESALAGYERILPEDHPDLLRARTNLAASMKAMGDLTGARALQEAGLAARERSLPEDHPMLLVNRGNLASSMEAMGDLAGAHVLRESVLAGYERSVPEDHPLLLLARGDLALSMEAMGDLSGARTLFESVLAGYERSLPGDHPYVLRARENLAGSMNKMGDLAEARALHESVLAGYERNLPEDHPDLLTARVNLASLMHRMGDLVGARALLPAQLDGMQARILASLALAPRQARQAVASERFRHSEVLFLSGTAGPELEQGAFELTETMRLVASEAARSLARFETDAELAPILEKATAIRRALNDLVAGAAREGSDAAGLPAELTRLSLERDALEREASRRLSERGVVTQPVALQALVAALAAGDAAIGYRRITIRHVDGASGETRPAADHLLAHVLTSAGKLSRIDLGPTSEIEELASEWRAALGAPLLRGLALEDEEDDPEARAGSALRARVLDPVLALVEEGATRLFICADDLLYLLPLDALPLDTGGAATDEAGPERIGDRLCVVNEVSFARLLAPAPSDEAAPSLLAFGGVDYDAPGAVPAGLPASSAPIEADGSDGANGERDAAGRHEAEASAPGDESNEGSAGEASASRSALPARFQKLLQARYEAEATADLFEEAFDVEPALLTKKKTTKAALFEAAAGKRYLHLATHGWFAPESVRSTEDALPVGLGVARMGIEERVSGLAPMTLCGLALAGANKGRDSLGRVPGILTAEELCALDLSQCELAVLSACETNVGIRRAGQGIQSLQSALYAAGARTSITSLWKVDDAATRRLMEVFYTNLWIEGMGKAEALWEAKQALRDEGHPPAHWAGWVLTGDPN